MMGAPVTDGKEGGVTFRVPMPRFSRRGPHPTAVLGSALALAWLAGACAAPPAPAPGTTPSPEAPARPEPQPVASAPPAPDECAITPAGPPGADTVRVVAGSGFAARQLYQTLIRLDCAGRLRPALADAWVSPDGGLSWTFSLGVGRFWDGTPVTSETVKAGWMQDSAAATRLRRAGVVLITTPGDRELRILFAAPRESVPEALADPRLAITRRAPDSAWPVGTGPYHLPETDPAPTTLEPVGAGRPVRMLSPPPDLRDAIDAGADLVVTDDPATLAYAAGRPELTSVPLPWSRTYALALTVAAESLVVTATGFREALARDAVRVDARAAAPPPFPTACAPGPAGVSPPPGSRPAARIGYAAGDGTARDLAARLAALGVAGARAIVPMDAPALAAARRDGSEVAFVVTLPRAAGVCEGLSAPPGAAVVPLVDVRAHALVRRGAPPLTLDWDGAVRLLAEAP
jgi:hypothetical protein